MQLSLFSEIGERRLVKRKRRSGGSQNPIVFHDYESFIAKFGENPKTTDECWTPQDVYEAVVEYVGTVTDLSDKVILRPFYPGGDFENAEYPENGIVIDNPPFSIFKKIVNFYTYHEIPFFFFGPGMTISNVCQVCTVVVTGFPLTYSNGAQVPGNFASSLFGDITAMTAPRLDEYVKACPSQQRPKPLSKKYKYPDEFLSVSDLQTICRGGGEFSVRRQEAHAINNLDLHPNGLFGLGLLVSKRKGAAKEAAREAVCVELSPREQRIVKTLSSSITDADGIYE